MDNFVDRLLEVPPGNANIFIDGFLFLKQKMLINEISYSSKEYYNPFQYIVPLFIQEIIEKQKFSDKEIEYIKKYTNGYENSEIRNILDKLRIPAPREIITFHGKDSFIGFSVSLDKRIAIRFDKKYLGKIYKVTIQKGDLMLILFGYSNFSLEYEIYLGEKNFEYY